MIISKLIAQDYIYVNVHAEQVITANYLESSRDGINVRELNLTTVQNLMTDLQKDISENLPKVLVLDFNLLAFIQPNIKSNFIELKKNYELIFVNIEKKIIEDIGFDSFTNIKNVLNGSIYSRFFVFDENRTEVVGLKIEEESLFEETFKEILKKYKVQGSSERHTSSFVYISSYIDIKKIITYERNLILFAIYKLALKISVEYLQVEGNSVKLVCQSLNGAFITSILSTYLNLDVVIFDKIGPINKLYSRLNKVIEEDAKYVVISDLVCLGTEVKIVKNIIQFLGGKYLGSISLIKVETLKTIKKEDMTTAIFSINRKNNKELGYSIYTNLEDIDKNE